MRIIVLAAVALLPCGVDVRAADVPALSGTESLQRALYGVPREATIEQVLLAPADFEGRAVALRGRFTRARVRSQFLLGTEPSTLRVEPMASIAARVRARSGGWIGQDVELVGVFLRDRRDEEGESGRRYLVRFWHYRAPDPP